MPTALITGITGQDGSHLAELLLDKGYRVCGMVRRSSTENFLRIEHLRDQIELLQGDLLDAASITNIVEQIQPDEVYNLAAMSFVPTSWQQPVLTAEFTAVGVTRMLEGDPHRLPEGPFLPGQQQRNVRQGAAKRRKAKPRRSIRAAPTASPRSMATSSPSITAKATIFSPAPASCSTTKARAAAWSS